MLFRAETEFLGKVVSSTGISIAPSKIEAVKAWPRPNTPNEVLAFLGFLNYHRDHLKDFASLSACLYDLAHTKGTFLWEEAHEEAFIRAKTALVSAPCLSYPRPEGLFVLDTDASDHAIGAVLSQVQGGKETVICYASHVLLKPQRKYCTTRKELLAVVKFCRHFRHYLLGRRFMVRTDHNSLVWLMRFKHIEGQLARWLEELAQFDMEILHRPGNKHTNADAMSRLPGNGLDCDCYVAGATPESLPCGGCHYCMRAHNQWSRFAEEVDDVVPLSRKCIPVISQIEDADNAFNIFTAKLQDDCYPSVSWVEGYSAADIARMQQEDTDIGPVINWLENKEDPAKSQLHLESPTARALWLFREYLYINNGILYYEWIDKVDRKFCLVVPTSLMKRVLELCHDTKTSGHLGQQKTYHRVKQSFYWHNLSQDCTEYVKGCSTCNQNKKPHIKSRAALKSYHAGFPMERVHLDILGPFNTSEAGNNYILMMIDQFTKWIEMAALPDQTALSVAHKFVTHFIVTFGCPMEVHTDQGRNFDSNLFQALCDELQIAKTRTTPYHPSSNGQVERYNTTVLQMIRCFIEKDNKN